MNKLLKLLAAFIAVTGITFAETALTESLSVGGFVDMSYTDGDRTESTSGIDQVEFNFTLDNGGPVTTQLDIEYENGTSGLNVEQAYITYDMNSGATVTVGRFETMLLQDASEPTGLYQYSNAYDFFGLNLNKTLYDLGDQGIKYSNGNFAVSLVDNGDSKIGDGNATATANDGHGDYSYEISYSGKLSDKVTGFIGGRLYENDANNHDGDLFNVYLTYEEGPWVVGGEYVTVDGSGSSNLVYFKDSALYQKISNAPAEYDATPNVANDPLTPIVFNSVDVDLFSLFANYSYSEKNSITVRYSDISGDAVANNSSKYDVSADKITLAHNSALSDDLALVLEYSKEDSKHTADQGLFAVELLYAF